MAVTAALQTVGIGVIINTVDASAYYDHFYGRAWDLVLSETSGSIVSSFTSGGDASPLWATPELADEVAIVPLASPSRLWAVGPAVHGFDVPVTEYDMDLTTVTVTR